MLYMVRFAKIFINIFQINLKALIQLQKFNKNVIFILAIVNRYAMLNL